MSPSTPGDAALSVPVSPPRPDEMPAPVPVSGQAGEQMQVHAEAQAQALAPAPHAREHGDEQGSMSASAPYRVAGSQFPGGIKPSAAGDEAKAAGVLSTPTTPVPSIENQNDKWARGPVYVPASASVSASASASATASAVPKRPNGPSLLTQQLAEARGISVSATGQPLDAPHPNPRLQQPLHDLPVGSHPRHDTAGHSGDTIPPRLIDDSDVHNGSDGDSLTPRASPRAVAMATTTAVSTLSLASRVPDAILSRTLDTAGTGDVEQGPRRHRELLRPSGRGMSLERTDKERRLRELAFSSRTYSDTSVSPTMIATPSLDQEHSKPPGKVDPSALADQRSNARPRNPDHRISTGPEKVWSIGSEDLNNAQDGLVEKSIAEVLAGVEPNARSRKASHSLRFFKEGLPEEKSRTRESRPGPKEKHAVTDDILCPVRGDHQVKSLQPSPAATGEFPARLARTKTFPLPSTDPLYDEDEPVDYFKLRPGDNDNRAKSTAPQDGKHSRKNVSSSLANRDSLRNQGDEERHDHSSDAAAEDGELSGEEKISSAVFVPHKGPQDSPDGAAEPDEGFDIPIQQHQRNEDGSSWLVKADEPEADEPDVPDALTAAQSRDAAKSPLEIRQLPPTEDTSVNGGSLHSISPELKLVHQKESHAPQIVSPGHADHAHDHQSVPSEPLDAIELVPYRHQVGGHTTLWRFSKRAVCKQLNNRENEFYEQIEKHHRDLLPFLPRYIGVLNVTFSKQSRRKSTPKRDADRKAVEQKLPGAKESNGVPGQDAVASTEGDRVQVESQTRMISQSMHSGPEPIPTVTFLDNQHILPRSLLQPVASVHQFERVRSSSVSLPSAHYATHERASSEALTRPKLEDRHANSWGTTVVNKKLRHEVFNDAFLKSPINVQRHKKAYQRTIPRKTLDRLLRPASSDSSLMRPEESLARSSTSSDPGESQIGPSRVHQKTQSDVGPSGATCEASDGEPNDVTGTSAPEPDILSESMTPQRRKRRHSGSALRRRPKDVSDSRGNLRYWEEPDEAGYKGDHEDLSSPALGLDKFKLPEPQDVTEPTEAKEKDSSTTSSAYPSTVPSLATSPTSEFKKIPRPINPKEAQTQRDSRVSYFLLLEDLTAGMKKPCIMDLKMGTRQYGVEATAKKQKSQQRKCAQTTSRELGVRVCGLQVWDAKTEQYVFRDKYYGRSLKAGSEFQEALARFLYDGVDQSSILRHIPTVLQKLSKLEVIVRRLRGYRFYAASLLVTYDGDQSDQESYDTAIEDSTTDAATDNEDSNYVRKRKNKREIDFKIADFANSLTPQDLANDKPCPPQHPEEPDRGFLKGLRSLRWYFLKIQQETRAEMGLPAAQRNVAYDAQMDVPEEDELVSE